jgi:hypothetical protein
LGTIIAEQLLEVDPSAHLVFDVKGKNIRVVSFDLHLLDGCMVVAECHRWCRGKKRRKEGKLENPEMWLVPPAAAQDANLVALGRMRELGVSVAKTSRVPQIRPYKSRKP